MVGIQELHTEESGQALSSLEELRSGNLARLDGDIGEATLQSVEEGTARRVSHCVCGWVGR